jgi:light-harvesting protein B-800-850 alpha chain
MNQGRIWCVVHPTVGLPLFLGSVALTSLAVHTAVMTHTTWMSSYWAGATRVKVSSMEPAQKMDAAYSVTVAPATVAGSASAAAFVITVTPRPEVPAAHTASPIRSASAN